MDQRYERYAIRWCGSENLSNQFPRYRHTTLRDVRTAPEFLQTDEAPLSESWQVSGTTLLGSKYTLLRCVWCPYADGHRHIKKMYRMR